MSSPEDNVRLHIRPLNESLLEKLVGGQKFSSGTVKDVFIHKSEAEPEGSFGFLSLPKGTADALLRKYNHSTIQGRKLRIQKAKPETWKDRRESSEEEISTQTSGVISSPLPALRPFGSVLTGSQVKRDSHGNERHIKRGWIIPKRIQQKGGKEDRFFQYSRCAFKTRVPPNRVSDLKQPAKGPDPKTSTGTRPHRKEATIVEFGGDKRRAWLGMDSKPGGGPVPLTYFDESRGGWVAEDGTLVEAVGDRRARPAAIYTAAEFAEAMEGVFDEEESELGNDSVSELGHTPGISTAAEFAAAMEGAFLDDESDSGSDDALESLPWGNLAEPVDDGEAPKVVTSTATEFAAAMNGAFLEDDDEPESGDGAAESGRESVNSAAVEFGVDMAGTLLEDEDGPESGPGDAAESTRESIIPNAAEYSVAMDDAILENEDEPESGHDDAAESTRESVISTAAEFSPVMDDPLLEDESVSNNDDASEPSNGQDGASVEDESKPEAEENLASSHHQGCANESDSASTATVDQDMGNPTVGQTQDTEHHTSEEHQEVHPLEELYRRTGQPKVKDFSFSFGGADDVSDEAVDEEPNFAPEVYHDPEDVQEGWPVMVEESITPRGDSTVADVVQPSTGRSGFEKSFRMDRSAWKRARKEGLKQERQRFNRRWGGY
ncbi:hypothetical protein P152DRAFT_455760 [Eremomyces bilateralis CBS 781.70]|uniref:RRM domain-containing protein n=1 Tax=Eremomyces bilateralis CBS 781.70 TaxID=1392243 RepID=A0A6G1G9Z3_9PEZI|nr:uncharacterized protein P152DRAFT_455760 [Eremomyces bilateralis CBS 781.70]KAF1814721.1 hypothetical protein P152DRAFT_455760 [Eremomyces bilateralis CBS 781.70]